MAKKTDMLRVYTEDKQKMLKECRNLFLEEHPEFDGAALSQAFMFHKLVAFYLE
jgi:hypothetical protein